MNSAIELLDVGSPGRPSTGALLTVGLLLGIAWWRRRDRDVAA